MNFYSIFRSSSLSFSSSKSRVILFRSGDLRSVIPTPTPKSNNNNKNTNNNDMTLTEDPPLSEMRRDYQEGHLEETEILSDPFQQFQKWLHEEVNLKNDKEPNAMTLSTCTKDAKPSARIVLLKDFDENGFVFYTNYNSRKSKELIENPFASITFYWTQRQIRIEGSVVKVSKEQSEAYFKTRPRASQIGAWVSEYQSSEITKQQLVESQTKLEEKFEGAEVPMPPFWGGWRVIPSSFEFWQGRGGRIHDRLFFKPHNKGWEISRLSP
ncbi:hypothetical protein CYY_006004 [Polysphondylium violaceum]|uniref:Pyridoxine-5'-phosphate oxidase n=1 Tax=Polysphondylium violaceum TaxID=133409 RepID=A0A8J4PRI6_9MYCE|nr:hypothetical protein CYY_006004 [Polysphondylium violaceum]